MTPVRAGNIFDLNKSDTYKKVDVLGILPNYKIVGTVSSSPLKKRHIYKERQIIQGDMNMDDSTKMLLDRLDKDLREHRQEIRDRDARLQAEFQEREKRIREETKEREERILRTLLEIKQDMQEFKNEIKEDNRTTRNTVIALTVSVILGVAAIVVAFVTA